MPVILIIEDDRDLREMLRSALLRKDYTVLEADNGKEALINFNQALPTWLLLISLCRKRMDLRLLCR